MQTNVLLSWIGVNDLQHSKGKISLKGGPVLQAIKEFENDKNEFSHVYLLHSYSCDEFNKSNTEKDYEDNWIKYKQAGEFYIQWLKDKILSRDVHFQLKAIKMDNPNDISSIYNAAKLLIDEIKENLSENCNITLHMSPGTPAMSFSWACLALSSSTKMNLIAISRPEDGIKYLEAPFRLHVETIRRPSEQDQVVFRRYEGIDESAFTSIIQKSKDMQSIINEDAKRLALYDFPVLILGETGVGKSMLAEAIHKASKRNGKFISVNCSAIPEDLIESELFGYCPGSFTGGLKEGKDGKFKESEGGTIFLDEIGELSKSIQVKLLAGPLIGRITPIGGQEEIINVRIITATNRDLNKEVSVGNFRLDLFYRLAVGIIEIKPLRLRKDDLPDSICSIINEFNREYKNKIKKWQNKIITKEAEDFLINNYELKGNFRELQNILFSAMKYPDQITISRRDIEKAISLVKIPDNEINAKDEISIFLNRICCENYNFKRLSQEEKKLFIGEALKHTRNNKGQAAGLLKISRQAIHKYVNQS